MPNVELDHIAVIAPTIDEGVEWIATALGVTPPEGGRHPLMGTRNHVMQIGNGLFLEVISIDDTAPRPPHPRWFGLDDASGLRAHWRAGRRLRAFVGRTRRLGAAIGASGLDFGAPMRLTRGDLSWHFGVKADGALPLEGALPHLMDWGEPGTPVARMADLGVRLKHLAVETPHVDKAMAALAAIGFVDPPQYRPGAETRLFAIMETPGGMRLLT